MREGDGDVSRGLLAVKLEDKTDQQMHIAYVGRKVLDPVSRSLPSRRISLLRSSRSPIALETLVTGVWGLAFRV